MAQRKRLESKKTAELRSSRINGQKQILVAHTVFAFPVDTGLVGSDHTFYKRLRAHILPDLVRALVHSEEEAHTVTGAVSVVAQIAPKGKARCSIYSAAGSPCGKYCACKVYMSLQHKGVVTDFFICAVSKRNGPGDICSAAQILSSRIAKVKTVRFEQRCILFRRDVVRQSGSLAVGGYGFETVSHIIRNLRAVLAELDGGVPFADALACCKASLKPVQELLHCKAVSYVALPHPLYFLRVLHFLALCHRARPEHHPAADRLPELGIDTGRIQPQRFVFQLGKREGSAIVRKYGDTLLCEHIESVQTLRVLDFLLEHIPICIVLPHKEIGYGHRIVFYVGGTDVQKPGDFVQSADKDGIASVFGHSIPQPRQFLLTGLPRPDAENGSLGDCGPVFPKY